MWYDWVLAGLFALCILNDKRARIAFAYSSGAALGIGCAVALLIFVGSL